MAVTEPPSAHPKRRRGQALQHAIFEAVFEQISEIGYARLTMDRLAAAAGTSKAVLYRRWDSKEALVLDALRESMPTIPDLPERGSLREDLLVVLGAVRSAFAVTRGTAFHAVAAEAGADCRALGHERLVGPAQEAIRTSLRRAAERGEIRPQRNTGLIATIGPALLRNRAIDGEVPPESLVTEIVDEILLPLLSKP